jgi:GGDEF domain-containing protein
VARLAAAGADPPVGLVLVGWEPPDEEATEYRHQTERSVAFVVAATTDADDTVTAASTDRVAIIKAPLRAPAAAEGLAHRVARALDVELDRLSTASDRAAVPWAIGVAVDRPEDRPDQLLRHAEAALDDAWLQGGRRVVAFDDEDRDLADPTG